MPRLPGPEDLGQRPTPTSPGGIAQYRGEVPGLEATGTAQMNLGKTISNVGDELWHEQNRLDTIKAEEAFNDLRRRQLDLTIGEKGFANLKGGDAVQPTYFPSYMTQFGRAVGEVAGTLTNDRQKELFKRRADVASVEFKGNLLNHAVQQSDAMAKATTQATVDTEIANIAANPLDDGKVAFSNLRISEALSAENKRLGIPNDGPIALEQAQKVQDATWQKRIDAVLYSDPIRAEQLFRANEKQITNPETRLLLQHKTREAAVTMKAGISADKDVNDSIAGLMKRSTPRATPEGGPDTGSMTDTGERVPKSVRQNNPGNIVDVKTGEIRTFTTPAEGAAALESEIKLKLSGSSPAYKARFGVQSVTPERLAETWAPAGAPGNSAISTTNYANAIATAVGIKPGDPIPNTPQAVAAVKQAITAFEAGAYAGGTQKASISTAAQYQTNETPDARDVAAQLPILLAKAKKRADEQYGTDPTNPDRFAFLARYEAAIKSNLGSKVAQLTAMEQENLDEVSDFVQGFRQQAGMQGGAQPAGGGRAGGPGMMRVTSIPALQAASPEMFQRWQRLSRTGREHVAVLMEQAQRADERGTPALYNEYRNRINLPPDDPNKVNWIQTISQDPRVVAGGLSQGQWSSLRSELKDSATDDGRTQAAKVQSGARSVRAMIMGDGIFTNMGIAKDKAELAIELWQRNADKVIGQYKAANKDIGPLFDPTPGAKESLITPTAIAPFKVQAGGAATSAEMLAKMAAAPGAKPPPAIKNDAEYDTLPPGPFIDPNGKLRNKPGQASAVAGAAPDYGARADGTQKGTGYFGALPAAGGKVSTEISVGVNLGGKEMEIPTLVPTLTRPEIDHLLAGQPPTKEIVDKAVAHAKTRLASGKDPFAGPGDQGAPPAPLPTMNEQGKIIPPPAPEVPAPAVAAPAAAAPITADAFELVDNPTTVGGNIASIRKARARALEIRQGGAQGPQFELYGPTLQLLKTALEVRGNIHDAILSLPKAIGEALAQIIPTELDAVHNGFQAIKKNRKVTPADEDILTEVLKYGLLSTEDEALAKGLLVRLQGKK